MKITLGCNPNIKCPKCGTKPTITTGFGGSLFAAVFLNKLEKNGGTVTCSNCKTKFTVKGK